MSRKRARDDLRNISQLDVTPLVDLTFLLLIVFIITAPALENAVDVKPPAYNAEKIEPDKHLMITLTRGGLFLLGGREFSREQLQEKLQLEALADSRREVFVRADQDRRYGEVMELMKVVRNAGFREVSLVTEAEETK